MTLFGEESHYVVLVGKTARFLLLVSVFYLPRSLCNLVREGRLANLDKGGELKDIRLVLRMRCFCGRIWSCASDQGEYAGEEGREKKEGKGGVFVATRQNNCERKHLEMVLVLTMV